MNSSFNQTDHSFVDKEHTMQIQLINLLSKAVSEDADDSEKLSILDQLISFSQVHFMSEQLIMRQHSYHGFDEHDNEHNALIDYLQNLKQKVESRESEIDLENLNDLREMLLNHIGSQDQKFSLFLSEQQA